MKKERNGGGEYMHFISSRCSRTVWKKSDIGYMSVCVMEPICLCDCTRVTKNLHAFRMWPYWPGPCFLEHTAWDFRLEDTPVVISIDSDPSGLLVNDTIRCDGSMETGEAAPTSQEILVEFFSWRLST
jgi:hypothetical protein